MANTVANVMSRIKHEINASQVLHDVSHIGVDLRTTGFLFWKKNEIHIAGRVDTDREKEEVDKILDEQSNGITIVNKLRVERR